MLQHISPLAQATLGTLFTWALTAAGAAVVIIFRGTQRKLLDSSLGFAAGVMTAASYWSLLVPAIEIAKDSKNYGENGEYVFFPVTVGFLFGGLFVYLTDVMISKFSLCAPHLLLAMEMDVKRQMNMDESMRRSKSRGSGLPLQDLDSSYSRRRTIGPENKISETNLLMPEQKLRPYAVLSNSDPTSLNYCQADGSNPGNLPKARTRNVPLRSYPKFRPEQRRPATVSDPQNVYEIVNSSFERDDNMGKHFESVENESKGSKMNSDQWKRIVLLIIAITVHNIPEGLAVGVRFGAVGSSAAASFESARNLAIGIGIQNFPEGLAVSLPLRASGFSLWKSFWYGQLSGMVEPIFGALGAVAVSAAKPLLPFALAFAAGAMIYVVVDDIIPEANSCDNGKLATWGTILGFIVMMVLEVCFGG